MKSSGPRARRRMVVAVVVGAPALGLVSPAHALLKDSLACRKVVQAAVEKMAKGGMDYSYKCRKAQDKLGLSGAACNVITPGVAPFDPKIPPKFQIDLRDKLKAKIDAACKSPKVSVIGPNLYGTASNDVFGVVNPYVEGLHIGNSLAILGNLDLVAGALATKTEKARIACLETVGAERGKIALEVMKASAKCQLKVKDPTVTNENNYGGLDPACVTTEADLPDPALPGLGMKEPAKARIAIQKKCTLVGVSASDIGTCSPLPECMIESSITVGQQIAAAEFALANPVCGNGVLEQGEQCDDNNLTDGDGCNSACEIEGKTCTDYPPNTVIGARTVTVSVNVPGAQKLAGVQVNLEYPQIQAGITGTGQSSIVLNNVSFLQDTSIPGDYSAIANDTETDLHVVIASNSAEEFIDDGDLFSVNMDACVPFATNFCNRTPNVIGCCDGTTDTDGDTIFQECVGATPPDAPPVCALGSFPLSAVGTCTAPEDGCPGDNACITQAAATTCTVTGASDTNGQPVPGVTCSLVVSGS